MCVSSLHPRSGPQTVFWQMLPSVWLATVVPDRSVCGPAFMGVGAAIVGKDDRLRSTPVSSTVAVHCHARSPGSSSWPAALSPTGRPGRSSVARGWNARVFTNPNQFRSPLPTLSSNLLLAIWFDPGSRPGKSVTAAVALRQSELRRPGVSLRYGSFPWVLPCGSPLRGPNSRVLTPEASPTSTH